MTTEHHIVIACPPWWSQNVADILAHRLIATELPSEVGVFKALQTSALLLVERMCEVGG